MAQMAAAGGQIAGHIGQGVQSLQAAGVIPHPSGPSAPPGGAPGRPAAVPAAARRQAAALHSTACIQLSLPGSLRTTLSGPPCLSPNNPRAPYPSVMDGRTPHRRRRGVGPPLPSQRSRGVRPPRPQVRPSRRRCRHRKTPPRIRDRRLEASDHRKPRAFAPWPPPPSAPNAQRPLHPQR
jgi:hypothetical protein